MRRILFLVLVFSWSGNAVVCGRPAIEIYPRAQLEADAQRYGEQIRAEYAETILPVLTPAERSALATTKFEFPIAGPKGDPFEFYTDGNTVYLPAFSLRFFADLCLASAWLNQHGFDGTTVRNYVGLLFWRVNHTNTPPPPVFKSLGVPADAREEPAVAQRADRNFGNVVVFLLAHELGHILKKHRASAPAQEIAADAFAIEVMRRIGQLPLGLEFWFDVERYRHDPTKYSTEAAWQAYLAGSTHPVTDERLNALAAAIEKAPDDFARPQTNQVLWTARARMFAQMFRLAAPFAGNRIARQAEYENIRDLRLVSLKPRKAAFAAPRGDGTDEDFQGLFRVRRTFADGGPGDEVDLLLLRNGDEVAGHYTNAKVDGSFEGKIAEGVLRGTWQEEAREGKATVESVGDKLRATWGTGAQDKGAGSWEGARVRR